MRTFAAAVAVLLTCGLTSALVADHHESKKPKFTIKDVMKKVMKGSSKT